MQRFVAQSLATLTVLVCGSLLSRAETATPKSGSAAKSKPAVKQDLTIHVVDSQGQSIAGAKVGPYIHWEGPQLAEATVYGFGDGGAANVSDDKGMVTISSEQLKSRMYSD